MLIVQISDCHIVSRGERAYRRVDTGAFLARAVAAIRALPQQPDLILASGDLVQAGKREEYQELLALLRPLSNVPFLPVAGNHDDRELLRETFDLDSRFAPQPGFIQYAAGLGDLRIVVIDTVTPHSDEPALCEDRLGWIRHALRQSRRPTLLAMHHPPFAAGIRWMEPKDRTWPDALAGIIAHHPEIVRIVCGHVHRPMTVMWAGVCAMSAPSTAHQVFPDLTSRARPQINLEAPGFLMHKWDGFAMTSYAVAIPGLTDKFSA